MLTKIKILIPAFLLVCLYSTVAQQIKVLSSGTKTSIRGMSVVNDRVVWVSGSEGTVGLSLDSGNTFKWMKVKGFEKTDFRDIEAFDETSAVIMGISEPAYILRTADAGDTWKVVYESNRKGMFLDAMEFWNLNSGIVIGDPIDNKIFIARTFNGGIKWDELPAERRPIVDSGEAMFASSGTNVRALDKKEAIIVTGGLRSRLIRRNDKIDLPILQGTQSTGANSVAVNKNTIIVVGGDFSAKDNNDKNCVISNDKGKTFHAPKVSPTGYRSCIEFLNKNNWITCGLNGVDISADNGETWKNISAEGFHVCRKAKEGKAVFFAGSNGKIGKLLK